jgi:Flp pilus assembly pilin Flp
LQLPPSALFARFLRCTRGTTALEYCFIGFLISVVAIAAMTAIGGNTLTMYQSVLPALSN